jgi:hypothetical protein
LYREVRAVLAIKLKKILWIGFIFLLIGYPLSCMISISNYRENQILLTRKNMSKVTIGMTYKDVTLLLGYPNIVLFSTAKDLESFKKARLIEDFFVKPDIYQDSKTKTGGLDWLYFYGPDNIDGCPIYSFNSVTGRLIRVSSRFLTRNEESPCYYFV